MSPPRQGYALGSSPGRCVSPLHWGLCVGVVSREVCVPCLVGGCALGSSPGRCVYPASWGAVRWGRLPGGVCPPLVGVCALGSSPGWRVSPLVGGCALGWSPRWHVKNSGKIEQWAAESRFCPGPSADTAVLLLNRPTLLWAPPPLGDEPLEPEPRDLARPGGLGAAPRPLTSTWRAGVWLCARWPPGPPAPS